MLAKMVLCFTFVLPSCFLKTLQGQINKWLVSGYPTDPNILRPTQTFLKAFGILSLFLDLLKGFLYFFHTKKVFIRKSLPT